MNNSFKKNEKMIRRKICLLASYIMIANMVWSQPLPDYLPKDGLVGWWPFNGNARDESGNGNDGVVYGADSSIDRFGVLNKALRFDGVNDRIEVVENSLLNDLPEISFSYWVNVESFPSINNSSGLAGIVTKWYGSGICTSKTDHFGSWVSNDARLYAGTRLYPKVSEMASPDSIISTNKWYNLTFTHDNESGGKFYLNGKLVSTVETTGELCVATNKLYFGCDNGLGILNRFYNGKLDDIGIWNRALTPSEVEQLYTGEIKQPCLPDYVPTDGLVGYWPFCGDARDESGNGNDGVVNGATLTGDRLNNENSAYNFNSNGGINQHIRVPSSDKYKFNDGITVSLWKKLDLTGLGPMYLFCRGWDQAEGHIGVIFDKTRFLARINGLSSPSITTPPSFIIEKDRWYNITFTHDNSISRLFVDGTLISEMVNRDTIGVAIFEPATTDLFFGKHNFDSANYSALGSIDDIGIWNRALTPAEVEQLYTGEIKQPCLPDYVPTDGLVGYWPFCGDASDESGNGNDGVVNGATLVEDREGNTSSAYYFNGNLSNRIAVDLNQPMPAFGDKTFSIWMKIPNEYIHPYSIVLEGDNQVPGYGNSYLSTQGNEPSYINANTVGRFYEGKAGAMSTIPLNDDQWHHVVLINKFKDSKSYVYIDGMLNTTKTALNNYLQDIDINTITIGNVKEYWQTNAAVLGSLDDIGIWNRALTHTEIKALYQGTSTPIDTALTLALDTLTLTRGETAVLPVRVRNFSDILSGQGTFTFDPAVVEFQGVEAFGLDSLTAASFNLSEAAAGRIMMAWNQNDANPVSLADGATLFAMRFKALGSNTQFSAVNFASNPVALEFAGSDFKAISPVTLLPGRINTYSEASVAGQLLTESGDGIRSATLTATTPAIATTLSNLAGNYKLSLPENVAVTLTPSKGNDTLVTNGITVADVLRINRHILRITPLSTPYRIIAADVNQNGTVSSVDINLINALILGRIATYPSGKLWSFVPSDHVFSDPAKPFPFPSARTYPSFREAAGQDFIGMKLGDVDNSYSPMESRGKEGNPVRFYLENQVVQPAASITVPVRVRDFDSIAGFQFGLQWNPAVLRFTGVSTEPSLDGIITGQDHAADGWLNVLWTHAGALSSSRPDDEALLWLTFDVVGEGGSSSEIRLFSSATTPVLVVHHDLYNLPVESRAGTITVSSPTSTEDVEQNWQLSVSPNPFTEEIAISIRCAQSGSATLTAYDQSGRQVSRRTLEMQPGMQVVREGATWPAGMYLLRLSDASGRTAATFKVIRL